MINFWPIISLDYIILFNNQMTYNSSVTFFFSHFASIIKQSSSNSSILLTKKTQNALASHNNYCFLFSFNRRDGWRSFQAITWWIFKLFVWTSRLFTFLFDQFVCQQLRPHEVSGIPWRWKLKISSILNFMLDLFTIHQLQL